MKAFAATMLLATLLSAGCSSLGTGAPPAMSQQALCEQRGDGVWLASAGACIRCGGM